MRFLADNEEDRHPALQMVPMVDIVFQLLAFFVLSAQFRQFRQSERDFSMGYGESAPPGRAAAAEDLPTHIPVLLQRSGENVTITIGQARLPENDFDAIRVKLAKINMPAMGVRILADADLSVDQVARALDAVLASPMRNVSIGKLTTGPPDRAAKGPDES